VYFIPGKTMFLGYLVIQFGAMYIYSFNWHMLRRLEVEERSCRMGIQPMLMAEKDRGCVNDTK